MSNIKIRIRIGSDEIEVESPLEVIEHTIEFIPKIMDKMRSNSLGDIEIEKGDSLSDIILKIFRDDWGKGARRLGEVKEKLESYGLTYPKQSIAVTLMRLVQSGKLRRFKHNNEYLYTASIMLTYDGEKNG